MDSSTVINYFMPARILFGQGRFTELGEQTSHYGKKALIVTGRSWARQSGYTQQAVELLKKSGVSSVVFDGIEGNPTTVSVNRGGELARREKCDVVIGLGGGSALDAAKGIAAVAIEQRDVWDYSEGAAIGSEILPIVAVPTTAGTGSEVTPYAVMSNREKQRKDAFESHKVIPRVAILDPSLTLSLPPSVTASSGMDALAHAIESYTSKYASPISDLFAVEAIRLVAESLRAAVSNGLDIHARTNMLLANTLAGIAITHADTALAHVIGEAVGAIYNTDHGTTIAVTLPAVNEFNCVSNLDKYAHISALLEGDYGQAKRDAAMRAGQAVRNLLHDVGLPNSLSALGVTDIEPVLRLATRSGLTASNPRSASQAEIRSVIEKSM